MKKYLSIILILFFISCNNLNGKIISVHDGDSITLLSEGKIYKIRLSNIDCPELGQTFGQEAKEYTASLVLNKYVTAVKRDRDKYNRLVCDVYASGLLINKEVVKAGMAYVYVQYDKENLYSYELEAKRQKIGLWAYPNESPYKFRKQFKK